MNHLQVRLISFLASTLVSLASFSAKGQSYDLPFELDCKSSKSLHSGVAACSLPWGSLMKLKIKIPPTRGQLRVVDCDQVLTNGGNPDDFNMIIEASGFWLWQRRVIRLDNPPEFVFPLRNFNDCPIVVSVAGEKAGIQTGIILADHRFHEKPPQLHDYLKFSCAGPIQETSGGLAVCKGLEGSRFFVSLKQPEKEGTMFLVGTGCGITRTVNLAESNTAEIFLPSGSCVLDVGVVVRQMKLKTRFMLLGIERTIRKIDDPVMSQEGSNRRVYMPQGANLASTEIYFGNTVLWRSGIRMDSSYVIRPNADNGEPYRSQDKWPDGAIACNTAYAEDIDSVSGTCYDLRTMVEKPYTFK
jgi:hypothetical protein